MFCSENPWGRSATKKAQGFGRTVEHENDVTADYGLLSLPSAVLLLPHDAAEDKSWLTANERQNPKKCVACVKRRFMQNEHFSVKLAALHASELAFSTSESSSCPCNFLLPACVFHDIMRFLAWLRLILAHDVRAIVCCFWGLPEEIAKRPTPSCSLEINICTGCSWTGGVSVLWGWCLWGSCCVIQHIHHKCNSRFII